ncbi:MAG: DUF5681 domain-containing protein [Sphingomicrobium sp.]
MSDASPPARWTPGMKSPNPRGRPKGIVDKRQKLQAAFADEAVAIAKVVVDAALAGDMQAASIALSRLAAPLKAVAERVEFELDPARPLSDQAQQILLAVADGKVDPETGKTLIGCIQSLSGIRAVENLEERIVMLEAKAVPA